ncbi:non-muscle cofilin 1-like [Myripristis murdjan]|uniref:Cofilin-1-A-like n=1 Tax=Myripristis murdjan TaxID=586833 RepID=A0A667Y4Z3_9TELE|nr:cofilin-1-A-like [Myripristis murdjan]
MASGVKVPDDVVTFYQENMKIHKHGAGTDDQYKFLLLKIDKDKVTIDERVQVKELKGEKNIFKKILEMLPKGECAYALYDCSYETTETQKDAMVFIMCTLEETSVKERMLYASSCVNVKKCFSGVKFAWQITDQSDLYDLDVFVEKLSDLSRATITKIEGVELSNIKRDK